MNELMLAWLDGADCQFAVKDKLLEMGLPSMAAWYGEEKGVDDRGREINLGKHRALDNRGFFVVATPEDLEAHDRYLYNRMGIR